MASLPPALGCLASALLSTPRKAVSCPSATPGRLPVLRMAATSPLAVEVSSRGPLQAFLAFLLPQPCLTPSQGLMTLRPLLRPHTSRRPSRGAATSHGTPADPSSRIFTSAVPRQHSAPHQVRTTAPKCRITGRVRQADRLTKDSSPRRHRHDSVQAKLGGLAQDANPAFLVECGAQAVGRG